MDQKVLLLCLIPKAPLDNKKESRLIEIVESFGKLRRYNIFHRGPQLKAFIEPINQQSYQRILDGLNHCTFDLGLIMVFPSKKKKIVTVGPVKGQRKEKKSSDEMYGLDIKSSNGASFNGGHIDHQLLKKVTSQEQDLLNSANYAESQLSGLNQGLCLIPRAMRFAETSDYLPQMNPGGIWVDENGQHNQFGPRMKTSKNVFDKKLDKSINHPNNSVHNSCFLRVKCSNASVITPKMLENLMGSFGNILAMFQCDSHSAYVLTFQCPEAAANACIQLQKSELFGSNLQLYQISTATFDTIINWYQEENSLKIHFMPSESHRFDSISPPPRVRVSNVLLFTNLPLSLNIHAFVKLVTQIREPVKIIRRWQPNSDRVNYLTFFSSKDQAAEVMAIMHRKQVNGLQIHVMFDQTYVDC